MRPFHEDEFDQMFRERLKNYEAQPAPSHWLNIKKRLGKNFVSKRYLFPLIIILFLSLSWGHQRGWRFGTYSRAIVKQAPKEAAFSETYTLSPLTLEMQDFQVVDKAALPTSLDGKSKYSSESFGIQKLVEHIEDTAIYLSDTEQIKMTNMSSLSKMAHLSFEPQISFDQKAKLKTSEKVETKKSKNKKNYKSNPFAKKRTLSLAGNHINVRFRPQLLMNSLIVRPNTEDKLYLYNFAGAKPLALSRIGLRGSFEMTYQLSPKFKIYTGLSGVFQQIQFSYLLQDPKAIYIQLLSEQNQQLEVVPVYEGKKEQESHKIIRGAVLIGGEVFLRKGRKYQQILDISMEKSILTFTKVPAYVAPLPLHLNLGYRFQLNDGGTLPMHFQPSWRFALSPPPKEGAFRVWSHQISLELGIGLNKTN